MVVLFHNYCEMKIILKTLPKLTSLQNIISEVLFFFKFTYLVSVLVLGIITIIELKNIYAIDIFPGIDTPFDNVYFELKGK